MKKTYIQPSTLVKQLAIQKMICVSGPSATIDTKGNVNAANIDSRRSVSLWDDDEEE